MRSWIKYVRVCKPCPCTTLNRLIFLRVEPFSELLAQSSSHLTQFLQLRKCDATSINTAPTLQKAALYSYNSILFVNFNPRFETFLFYCSTISRAPSFALWLTPARDPLSKHSQFSSTLPLKTLPHIPTPSPHPSSAICFSALPYICERPMRPEPHFAKLRHSGKH